MNGRACSTIALSLFALVSCQKDEQITVSNSASETLVLNSDEGAMETAIETAKSRLDEFLAVLATQEADSFSVKTPISDDNGTEHFWITDISYQDGKFSGLVGNDPGMVETVSFGDEITITQDEVTDWMYLRGEKIHGGFTIDPLLKSYPPREAEALRAKLVR